MNTQLKIIGQASVMLSILVQAIH